MGIGGLREQNCRNARQPANGHRRVLAAVILSLSQLQFLLLLELSQQ